MNLHEAIEAFALHLQRRYRSAKTIQNYRYWLYDLSRQVGNRPLGTIQLTDLHAWLDAALARKVSVHTLWTMVITAQIFFRWCVRVGYIQHSPAEHLERPRLPERLPRALEPEEVRRLLEAVRAGLNSARDLALLLFMLDTGARLGAVADLTMERLYLQRGMALLRTKGAKEVYAFFGPETSNALDEWLIQRDPAMFRPGVPPNSVFGLRPSGIRQVLRRARERAGIQRRVSPHILRHTSATMRVEAGISETALQQLMGWSDARMARVYTRLARNRLQRLALKTSPVRILLQEEETLEDESH